ncbi:MAG: hypothetical protein [Circular genetic element sp.]|nr:MAG: hypothetical protein [Circular genetic element sp.]
MNEYMNKSAWEELEGLFILLENDEELDKKLKDMSNSLEYFLVILEHLSPLHELETLEDAVEYYIGQLAKLYAICFMDEELDKELGTSVGIESGYLTIALEKVIPANARREAIKAKLR